MTKYTVQNTAGQWLVYDTVDEHHYWADSESERGVFSRYHIEQLDDELLEPDGISLETYRDYGTAIEWESNGVVVARAVPLP